MAKAKVSEENPDEWGEFLHLPGQKFHDFSKIRDEIVRDTEKMTGKNAGESHLSTTRNGAEIDDDQVSRPTPSTCESSLPTSSPSPW